MGTAFVPIERAHVAKDAAGRAHREYRTGTVSFALGPGNASTVVNICARLEGLPLALELAAAHVSALALPQILERLDDSFRLLVGGSRTAHTRQQTMRATLDWSYALLSAAEQAVFQRLAVFAGGWRLEAAEAVCANGAVAPADVLELLTHLVDKSLVVAEVDDSDSRSRYRILEPIRQYARERLVPSGELDTVHHRHVTFFLAFAEALERDASVGGAGRHTAADALVAEYGNLLVALRWALDAQDADFALRLAWTLQYVWKHRLPVGEGRPWLEDVLALPGAEAPTAARTVSLLTAAQLAWERGDYATADRYYAEAVPIARRLNDPWILFVALVDQGNDAQQRGNHKLARSLWQEGLVVTRSSGDRASEAILLALLGRLDMFERNYAAARARSEESLHLACQIGDVLVTFMALDGLGLAALAEGDLVAARTVSNETLNVHASSVLWAARCSTLTTSRSPTKTTRRQGSICSNSSNSSRTAVMPLEPRTFPRRWLIWRLGWIAWIWHCVSPRPRKRCRKRSLWRGRRSWEP